MDIFQKFSISEAIRDSFKTYFKNFQFFLKIFGLAVIGSISFYFTQPFLPRIFSGEFGLIQFIAIFCGDILLNNLIIKNYDNSKLLRLRDFYKYDFNLGYYLLYYIFLFCIQSLPNMIFGLSDFNNNIIASLMLIGWILSLVLFIKYFWGKYLILDKNLTFIQSIRAIPYLVNGEKQKLLWSWFVGFVSAVLPILPFCFLGSYFIFGSFAKNYLTFIAIPFAIAFSYPIMTMVYISIYKQLMANADENFKKGVAGFEELNKSENDQEL